ncbi:MAG TPA: GNAT family N-acetyltransferase [Aggregatilineales bacterium]|nr:GNAT family N-acetyltransferase [Aggregatilineales bacterium]
MAAATAVSGEVVQGMRPVNLRFDLAGVTDLIEICFGDTMDEAGRAAIREQRMISASPSLLLLSDRLMNGMQSGFVWIDQGRIVGNVSVSLAGVTSPSGPIFMITNVAVHPAYRRQGIAYAMMDASLNLIRQRSGSAAILQVHATNSTAHGLYLRLGFRDERAFTRWRRPSYLPAPARLESMPFMTLRPAHEWRLEYELARQVRPDERGGMGWLHPTTEAQFRPSFLRALASWFIGQTNEHWIVRRPDNAGFAGVLHVTLPLMGVDRFDLLVDRAWSGQLEEPLVNYLLRRVAPRRRTLVTEHPADDTVTNALLDRYDFEAGFTEISMRRDL